VKVSLEYTFASFPIDLAEIVRDIHVQSKLELVRHIEECQHRIVMGLCGPRYSRNHSFKRAGSYTKRLTTAMGIVVFRVQKVRGRTGSAVTSPVLECLDVRRRRYSRDLRFKLAEYASKMSYQDASLEFETATGIHVPKRTIHAFVHEVAPQILRASNPENKPEHETVMGDSTEVRGLASRAIIPATTRFSRGFPKIIKIDLLLPSDYCLLAALESIIDVCH
jgi:hypothetical protein